MRTLTIKENMNTFDYIKDNHFYSGNGFKKAMKNQTTNMRCLKCLYVTTFQYPGCKAHQAEDKQPKRNMTRELDRTALKKQNGNKHEKC